MYMAVTLVLVISYPRIEEGREVANELMRTANS